MSNKIIALFISLLLLFNAAGFLLIFKIQQTVIQCKVTDEIEKHLSIDNLDVIVVDKVELENGNSKLNWLKEGKEFKYNGKMYDIVSTKEIDGKLFLYCRNDSEEEELFNNICSLIKKNISNKHILTFHISTFVKFESKIILPPPIKKAVINIKQINYKGAFPSIPEPPPRLT